MLGVFPLCMESNTLEKSTNKFYLEVFCMYSNDLMDSENRWSCGLISLETILIFPKNFFNFWSDTIEKQGIINLSSYSSKNHASVVLSNSKVIFLGGRGGCSLLSIFLLCFVYTQCCIIEVVCHQIFLSLILLKVFRWGLQLFCF